MSANESMQHGETQHVGAATRTVKRARLEADKRRDVAEKVQDKFYDIDYTKYQKIGVGNGVGYGRVRPGPSAAVANWRQLNSYEADGEEIFSEEEFVRLFSAGGKRRHYIGPFGCSVQSNVPDPASLLCNAAKPVQGRSALQKLQKQLGVMCLRLEVGHFEGRHSATISDAELQAGNAKARLVGGEYAVLTAAEAATWAPPAYPLVGDGLAFGGRSARTPIL